jgi:hypothetical protein
MPNWDKRFVEEWFPDSITVAELIAKLQQMPQDVRVVSEGCDCVGDVADVVDKDSHVYLARTKHTTGPTDYTV